MKFKKSGSEASSFEADKYLDVKERPKPENMPQPIPLNKHDYAQVRKARTILSDGIGTTSLMLQQHKLDYFDPRFRELQEKACKRAIATCGLQVALLSWGDLMRFCIELPKKEVNGTPLKFQPTVDFFSKFGGPFQFVDTEWGDYIMKKAEEKRLEDERKASESGQGASVADPVGSADGEGREQQKDGADSGGDSTPEQGRGIGTGEGRDSGLQLSVRHDDDSGHPNSDGAASGSSSGENEDPRREASQSGNDTGDGKVDGDAPQDAGGGKS